MSDPAANRVKLAGVASGIGIAQGTKSSGLLPVKVNSLTVQMNAARDITFAAGDLVAFVRSGATWVVTARIGTAAVSEEGGAATAPPANPPSVSGSSVITPVEQTSWQASRWRLSNDGIYQGQPTADASNNTGCAFYGNAFSALAGSTATGARVRMLRASTGGRPTAQPLTVWLVTQKFRPGGAPTLTLSTVGPVLAWGQSTDFTIPTAWVQAMIDGTAGGLALFESDGDPYIEMERRTSAAQFALTVDWTR